MQTGPDPRRRASLQPHRAVGVLRPYKPHRLATAFELAGSHREFLHAPLSLCKAIGLQWTLPAKRFACQADRGAQIHHALRVARHGLGVRVFIGHQFLRQSPQRALLRCLRQIALKGQQAG